AGDGYVLVGDAACFLDPLFSSGVHLALGGATLAATYVRTALANPASRAQAAQAYHSLYDKQYQYFRLTAQLFYGTNRSADSYFWEARRILGDDDATPRAAFVKVVGGQTPQGYERAVIERGVVPAGLLDEVQRMEAWFQQRKESTEALLRDPSALLRAVPTLAAQMRLEEKPVLGPQGYTPGFQIVSTGPEAIAGGYPVTAVIATCIGKMDGRRTVGEIIAAVQAEHGLQDGAALTGIVQRDLPTLIGGGMLDVTVQSTGRNEPCPCGSGKKYKRCHGGAGRG
ncbi:MAG: tryptophan 7-halogenase, partial [Chloroflexota bacterium]|nr:tryptophan 7-halogenase [Chloroflexota bacterium]